MVWVDASIKALFHLCSYISPVFPLSCSQKIKDITYIYQKTFRSFKKQGKFTQSGLYWWKKKIPNQIVHTSYVNCWILKPEVGSVTHNHKNSQSFHTNPSSLAKQFLSSRMSFPCTRELAHGFSLVLSLLHPFASAITPSTLMSPPVSYCFLSPMVLKGLKFNLSRIWVIQH